VPVKREFAEHRSAVSTSVRCYIVGEWFAMVRVPISDPAMLSLGRLNLKLSMDAD